MDYEKAGIMTKNFMIMYGMNLMTNALEQGLD